MLRIHSFWVTRILIRFTQDWIRGSESGKDGDRIRNTSVQYPLSKGFQPWMVESSQISPPGFTLHTRKRRRTLHTIYIYVYEYTFMSTVYFHYTDLSRMI